MSRSPMAEPATSIDAEMSSLAGRPAETETTTASSCILAERSARSAHCRTAASASARSITVPAFMPRATVWPKPDDVDGVGAQAQHVLRRARPEAPDQARDLAGPDVERGDEHRAVGQQRLHLRGEAELEGAHALPPFFFGLSLAASMRACAARLREPHGHAVGQPEIDGDDVARDQVLFLVERDQALERGRDIGSRAAARRCRSSAAGSNAVRPRRPTRARSRASPDSDRAARGTASPASPRPARQRAAAR